MFKRTELASLAKAWLYRRWSNWAQRCRNEIDWRHLSTPYLW